MATLHLVTFEVEPENDSPVPIQEPEQEIRNMIDDMKRLAGLPASPSEMSYGENISHTGTKLAQIQKERGIRPGDPDWFRLWCARTILTKEKPY